MIWFHWDPWNFPIQFLPIQLLYNRIFIILFHNNLDFRILFYNKTFINFFKNLYILFFDFYIIFKNSIFFNMQFFL